LNTMAFDIGLALWFGILTSISPCPLATNITAISFIGRRVESVRHVLLAGLLYTAGRMAAYTVLGILLVGSTQLVPPVANFLQKYMVYLLGPTLIIIGILLLDIFRINLFGNGLMWTGMQKRIEQTGIRGALLMGIIFALSFCPVSAALFFGSLFSLAIKHQSMVILPSVYGMGTAIPVLVFAFILAFSANTIGRVFNALTVFEKWARNATGIIFILAGLYLVFIKI
jgi:cytochrome c-type biogenesis protein